MLHSKQWYYSLHRDFQNCYSTRRILTRFFKLQFQLQFQLQCYTCTLHYNPENSPSRIQFYIQKTKSSSSTTVQKCIRVSYMTFQATPVAPETFQTFQSFMTFQPSRQFYNVPVSPGNPPHSSILRLECIFYIFYNFYSSIGFHRKLHRVPVGQLQTLQTFILQRKGDVAISVKMSRCQDDIFPRIELIPSFVLSSDNTNCKNDIQLFHQLFDELSVHTDYH